MVAATGHAPPDFRLGLRYVLRVNLFGHAAIAAWRSPEPEIALGAMLPDLVGLARVRAPEPCSDAMRAGIALHHETDRIFHASEPFVALCARALAALTEGGLARTSARAAAHVGIELLLDGELGDDLGARDAFGSALALTTERLDDALAWRDTDDPSRVRVVAARLLAADIPDAYRDPDLVAARLFHILARRPRLAFPEADLAGVVRWARAAQADVRAVAPTLLEHLRSATSD